jgi:hypothetical protein
MNDPKLFMEKQAAGVYIQKSSYEENNFSARMPFGSWNGIARAK